jgi:hypothetical protein
VLQTAAAKAECVRGLLNQWLASNGCPAKLGQLSMICYLFLASYNQHRVVVPLFCMLGKQR